MNTLTRSCVMLGPKSAVSYDMVEWEGIVKALVVQPDLDLKNKELVQSSEPSSPSYFESMDGLGEMELGSDALPDPVGPCGVLLFRSLLLIYSETSSS